MNLIQLLAFTWVSTWVVGESLFPQLSYHEKVEGAIIATLSIAYLNNVHGIIWNKIKSVFR